MLSVDMFVVGVQIGASHSNSSLRGKPNYKHTIDYVYNNVLRVKKCKSSLSE